MVSPSNRSRRARKSPVMWLSCLLLILGGIARFSSPSNPFDALDSDFFSKRQSYSKQQLNSRPAPVKLFGKDVYAQNVSMIFHDEFSYSIDDRSDNQLLPDRLISVFGLESSGTTFVTATLARILQATSKRVWGGADKMYVHHDDDPQNQSTTTTWIQHFSLPWGYFDQHTPDNQKVVQTIPFVPPLKCSAWSPKRQIMSLVQNSPALIADPHPACADFMAGAVRMLPPRFYVDIVSHIRRYRQAGVRATALLVVWDDYAHFVSKVHHHQASVNKALEEDVKGKQFLETAMQQLLLGEEVVVLSYETLMAFPKAFLSQICQQLGIQVDLSEANLPGFRNGNQQYIHPTTIMDKKGQSWKHNDRNPTSRKQYKAALQQIQQMWQETGNPGGQ